MALLNQSPSEYYQQNSNQNSNTATSTYGNYQFIPLGPSSTNGNNIIDNFHATYVGEGKILENVSLSDIIFHANRALAELSFDTLKSCKSQEIEVPATLKMPLPQDYVNYVKLTRVDSSGIERIIYPTRDTSAPFPILQSDDGDYEIEAVATLTDGSNVLPLDGEYKEIMVGDRVIGQHIPNNTFVESTYNSGGITRITLESGGATPSPVNITGATWTGASTGSQQTIRIYPSGASVRRQTESTHIVEGLTFTVNTNHITATSADDISDIKPGMKVSHECYPPETRVVSVNNTIIAVNRKPTCSGSPALLNGEITFRSLITTSDTWTNYKSSTPSENNNDDYEDDTYWPNIGQRYGLDPERAHINGSYFIDCDSGMIHFSSNLSGKTIILKYISDSLGRDHEKIVHKFAEEAIYKWIIYGCLSARMGIPEYVMRRFKKEKFAETRKAKLRLSNIKLEEITQVFRGKSKQIKH
tara:strand:+ start:1021 stop:2436 length:1416 start_codon:yes stop_codon:yes gene_type:complete